MYKSVAVGRARIVGCQHMHGLLQLPCDGTGGFSIRLSDNGNADSADFYIYIAADEEGEQVD